MPTAAPATADRPIDRNPRGVWLVAFLGALHAVLAACGGGHGTGAPFATAPATLAATGLYADAATRVVAADALPFSPQYPLWTDGAVKRRWIALPRGTTIDARDPEHWEFPIGTRLWKEFTFEHGVETRFMQRRADGSWLYATYVRAPGDADATLAPDCGVRAFCASRDGKAHDVPGIHDCRACHEGTRTPVLGFSALQLSPDRDAQAPGGGPARADDLDLPALVARGLVVNLPSELLAAPPRVAGRTPVERAALGYLHGNCSSCHNGDGPLARLGLRFDHPASAGAFAANGVPPAIATTVGVASTFTRGLVRTRVVPGAPERSVLALRLAADDPLTRMPPLGRHLVDRVALDLIERWIRTDLAAIGSFPSVLAKPAPIVGQGTAR